MNGLASYVVLAQPPDDFHGTHSSNICSNCIYMQYSSSITQGINGEKKMCFCLLMLKTQNDEKTNKQKLLKYNRLSVKPLLTSDFSQTPDYVI